MNTKRISAKLETISKKQTELKNTIAEIKSTPEELSVDQIREMDQCSERQVIGNYI